MLSLNHFNSVTASPKSTFELDAWGKSLQVTTAFTPAKDSALLVSIETIFAWPGVGRLMIGSIFQRDVPIVIAAVFIVCVTIIVSNLIVNIVQSMIDPRIRLE